MILMERRPPVSDDRASLPLIRPLAPLATVAAGTVASDPAAVRSASKKDKSTHRRGMSDTLMQAFRG